MRRLKNWQICLQLRAPTSQHKIFIYKLDRKNVLFFSFNGDHLILLSIYPYKKILEKANTINTIIYFTKSESVAVKTPLSLLLKTTFQLPS